MTPFDIVYAQLLQDIAADVVLTTIKDKNVIAYTQDSSPEKVGHATNDLPELTVYMSSFTGNIHASSSHSLIKTRWRFQAISSGYDSKRLHALAFAVVRVLTRWKNVNPPLTWKDRVFVKDVRLANADQGIAQNSTNIQGWATLMDAEIDLTFLTSDLMAND